MAVRNMALSLVIFLLYNWQLSSVNGIQRGKVVFELVSYKNEYLLDKDLLHCDAKLPISPLGCEIYFVLGTLFLDKVKETTTPVKGMAIDSPMFIKDKEPGYRHEVEIPRSSDPKRIFLLVVVWDQDGSGDTDDGMEKYRITISYVNNTEDWMYIVQKAGKSIKYWHEGRYDDHHYKTELKVKYRLECDPSFGGMWCNQKCEITESPKHICIDGVLKCKPNYYPADSCTVFCKPEYRYKCNNQGHRQCNKFWAGSDCFTLKKKSGTKYRGKIIMKVVAYENKFGLDNAGYFCDGSRWKDCHMYFYVHSNVKNERRINESSNFDFPMSRSIDTAKLDENELAKGSSNEFVLNIPVTIREEEDIKQTVEVWEDDNSYDDYMESYHIDYRKINPSKDWKFHDYYDKKDGTIQDSHFGHYKTKLRIKYKLECHPPFEGKLCYGRKS